MKTVALGELVKIVGGGTPSRANPAYYQGRIPWITVKDFSDELFLRRAQEHITEQAIKDSATNLIPAGNVILVTRMAVGRVAVNLVDVAINQDLKALFCRPELLDPNYLLFFLLSRQKQLEAVANGATVKGITIDDFSELQISLLSPSQQRRIAAILTKAHRLRRLRSYAVELIENYMHEKFLEMFGDPATNPKEWRVIQLEELLKFPPQNGLYVPEERYEKVNRGVGVEMVHMSDLFYGVVQRGNLKRANLELEEIEKYSINENDLLIARRSLTFEGAAKPCRIPRSTFPLVFESSMIRIRTNQEEVLPVYLYYYLSNERTRIAHVLKFVTESTISGINQNGLRNLEIIVPPILLQQKFAQIVEKHERLRVQQREAERQAEHLFQTLLYKAFEGELGERAADELDELEKMSVHQTAKDEEQSGELAGAVRQERLALE